MEVPAWLSKNYIAKTLQLFHKDQNLSLIKIKFKPALGKGENFGGVLTRVYVEYASQNSNYKRSLLVKSSFETDDFAKEKMKPYDVFNREMSIYENILPKLNELLKEIKDEDKLFAEVLRVDYDLQALIFEDLSERGYVMADRVACLDLVHVQLILRKIAKMHAASAVLNEWANNSLIGYDRGFFNCYTDNYASYFVGTLIECANFLKKLPGYELFGNKLLALEPYYMDIGRNCFAPAPNQVNVFAHGDLWTNNVMFCYDEAGVPKDALLIDFQYSFWGPACLDLHHLFNTSLKDDLRLYQQDELFQYYYGFFAETLNKLKYAEKKVPSLHQFRLQAEERRFFAFHSSCIIQPVMINESCEDADFNALMNNDERATNFKRNLYKNPRVQENLKHLLPIFDNRGILDINQCA